MVRAQKTQLLLQKIVHVLRFVYQPYGKFRRQRDPVPVPLDGAADELLALALVIGPGGVEIIDAAVEGGAHQPLGCGLVDSSPGGYGQAHTPEAQDRELLSDGRNRPVKHRNTPIERFNSAYYIRIETWGKYQ